jgi:exopolysaccharide biosynthesis polyprenyl glycosylphosphotransferase
MLKEKMLHLKRLHIVSDIILTLLSYYAAIILVNIIRDNSALALNSGSMITQNLMIIGMIWGFLILRQKSSYAYRMKAYKDMFKPVLGLIIKGTAGYFIWLYATKSLIPDRLFIILFLTLDFCALITLRLFVVRLLQYMRAHGKNCQQVLIIGTGDEAMKIVDDIRDNPQWGIRIIGMLEIEESAKLWRYRDVPLIGSLDELPDLIQCNQVDYVVITIDPKLIQKLDKSVSICEKMGVQVCLLTDFFNTKIAQKRVGEFLFRPAIIYSTLREKRTSLFLKTLIDRVGSFFTLILTTPIILGLSALIKLTSRGKVFFTQERVGLNGRRFKLYKFRTMVENAEDMKKSLETKNEMDGPVFKITNDPRITRTGRFLRKTSLDELPQLFNIIRGEMSFVGPRPPLPTEVARYDLWQRRKLSVKPGLTCLWQIGERNDTTFEEWMKLDLKYIDNWSLWMDTKILLKTIPTVINGTGK